MTVLVVLLASLATAGTFRVPSEHGTIQAAINAAALETGSSSHTIILEADTVENAVTFTGDDFTIRGEGSTKPVWTSNPVVSAPLITASGVDLTLEDLILDGNGTKRVLDVDHGDVTIVRTVVRNGDHTTNASSEPGGGCLLLEDGDVDIARSVFHDCSSEARGGALALVDAGGEVVQTTFRDNAAASGGAVYLQDSTVDFLMATFTDNRATRLDGGAFLLEQVDGIAGTYIGPGTFRGNTAEQHGGALACRVGRCDFVDVWFEDNGAVRGGAVHAHQIDNLTFLRGAFCHNEALGTSPDGPGDGDGGAIYLDETEGDAELSNNVFFENTAGGEGGAVASDNSGIQMKNGHIIGNRAHQHGPALFLGGGDAAVADVTSTLFFANQSSLGPTNLVVGGQLTIDYSLFDNNDTPEASDGSVLQNNTTNTDPLLLAYNPGDCSLDKLYPTPQSPLVDAGNPADADPDGGATDIGAFGGPDADASLFTDLDEDGVIALLDCDDLDFTVSEWVVGFRDSDGDGFGDPLSTSLSCGLPEGYVEDDSDCHDADPAVNPGASEDSSNADANCDGFSDPTDPLQLAACACNSSAPAGAFALAPLLLLVRRRRA